MREFKCECCGKLLPETREYFKWYKEKHPVDGWHKHVCRECEEKLLIEDNKKVLADGTVLYKCQVCGEWLTVDNFNKTTKHFYRDSLESRCRKCKNQQLRKARDNYDDNTRLLKMIQARWLNAKQRASTKNLPFTLTKQDVKDIWDTQQGLCAISKIPMTYDFDNGRTFTNLSIDQRNPHEGYTKENAQLVCMAVNQMKSDLSMDELYMFCEAILNNKNCIQNTTKQ